MLTPVMGTLSDELPSPTVSYRSFESPQPEGAPAWHSGQPSPAPVGHAQEKSSSLTATRQPFCSQPPSTSVQSIKVLCTAGGRFTGGIDAPDDSRLSYKGGQTRLLSLPGHCTYKDLLAMLAGKHWSSGSSVRQFVQEVGVLASLSAPGKQSPAGLCQSRLPPSLLLFRLCASMVWMESEGSLKRLGG
jgi:hypothetical protein